MFVVTTKLMNIFTHKQSLTIKGIVHFSDYFDTMSVNDHCTLHKTI